MKPDSSFALVSAAIVFIATLLFGASTSFSGYLQAQIKVLISWLLCMRFVMLSIVGLVNVLKKI
jgi:hypothetical protein